MNRTKKVFKSVLTFILALSLALTCMPSNMRPIQSHAEEKTGEEAKVVSKDRYEIKNEDDWMVFAGNCRLDEWSLGRTILLKADIDLSKECCSDFYGISSFSGLFYGNGHTVKGLSLAEGTEAVGLFRYLEKEGSIIDLKVEGEITSTDPDIKIGGIVGVNAGKLISCSFDGAITGKGTTGGLVGYNGASATVLRCVANGNISSSHSVGGAVGENRGIISESVSNAKVNSESTWFEDEDSGSSSISLSLSSLETTTSQKIKKGSDIGGIAGYSDGIIAGCKNNGIVGYLHTGRNVGGIVGRHGGTLIDCENNGHVFGKQDVGGIVGQFEPKTTQEESIALATAVNKLHDDIETMVKDMGEMNDAITKDIGQITDTAEDAAKTTEAITKELRDVIEKNVEVLNDLAGRVDYVCDHLPDVMDNLDAALDAMAKIGDDLSKISEDLDVISKIDDEEYDSSKYNRLSLEYGQGGSLSVNTSSPEEGESVTVTVNVDSCYELMSLTMTAYGESETDITSMVSGNTYTFTMPSENVALRATFSYIGQYYASSNPGGKVSFNGDDNNMTVKAVPNTDYTLKKILVGGNEVSFTENNGTFEANVTRDKSGKPIMVEALFEKQDVSENDVSGTEIVTVSSTGGTTLSSKTVANPGDEITFAVTSDLKYSFRSLYINDVNVTGEVESGVMKYIVPDGISKVEAKAEFSPIMVVINGSVGGNASYTVSGDKVSVRVNTLTGYVLNEPLTLKEENGSDILYEKSSASATNYSFDVTAGMKNGSAAYLDLSFSGAESSKIVKDALDRISENTKVFSDSMARISEINERINAIMDDGNGGIKDFSDLTNSEEEEVRKLLKELSDEMVVAGNAAAQIMADINTVIEIMGPYVEDAVKNLSEDLNNLSKHYSALTSSLKGTSKSVRSILTYLNALDDLQFVNLSDDFNKNTEKLSLELNQIIAIMKKLNSDTSHYSDVLEADLNQVNDQLNVVFNLLIERVNNLETLLSEDIIEDHSADENNELETSTISSCTNNGLVNADTNVGGIAGAISKEGHEAGSDNDESTEASFGSKYLASAIIDTCTNNGFITIRTENGGGIVGSMSLGYVKDCISEGSVYSDSASVLGGIAGYSAGTIEKCYSLSQLAGSEYLGGVAGKAHSIRKCLSMAYIYSFDAIIGAISGAYLPAEDESDDITVYRTSLRENYYENYYVSSSLYGIDEVSYASVAEPIDYRSIQKLSNRSDAFTSFEIIFLDEDENVVKRQKVNYGDSLDIIEYPDIAAETGDYFEWNGIISDRIEGNIILRAASTANVVVLESGKNEDGKVCGYAEGTFTERARLNISSLNLSKNELPKDLGDSATIVVYHVFIENGNLSEKDETKLRLLSPVDTEAVVYEKEGDSWKKIDSKKTGKYIQITLEGEEGIYCVSCEKAKFNMKLIAVCAGIGMGIPVIFALIVVMIVKTKKKHTSDKNVTQ